mmetsp:Transcript_24018/g.55806  ORF Transcript_24018/g.55806 Transcript_24018/m.55806 type:complete len:85 (+) Transcript_24018:38-292(+)
MVKKGRGTGNAPIDLTVQVAAEWIEPTADMTEDDLKEMIESITAENQALQLHNAHLLNLLTESAANAERLDLTLQDLEKKIEAE